MFGARTLLRVGLVAMLLLSAGFFLWRGFFGLWCIVDDFMGWHPGLGNPERPGTGKDRILAIPLTVLGTILLKWAFENLRIAIRRERSLIRPPP